ncbi:hypothetical protein [Amycolatopsis sp. w19]|uniref:hypothetical protein n=1 Tax=Amycolatopsis sp. w19 TaxID=3448134 RepID=UPI003F19A1F8
MDSFTQVITSGCNILTGFHDDPGHDRRHAATTSSTPGIRDRKTAAGADLGHNVDDRPRITILITSAVIVLW